MPLPYLVELIASYRESGQQGPLKSNPLVRQETVQVAGQIPASGAVPTVLNINTLLGVQNDHSFLVYRHNFSPAMVPNALNATVQYVGNIIYNGVVSALALARDFDCFIIAPRRLSYQVTLVNNTLLLQNYEYIISYLAIPDPEDYAIILNILAKMAPK